MNPSLNEESLLIFEVVQDSGNPNRFNVHDEFIDKESFEYHQQRVRNSDWGKVSMNIERHYHVNQSS